MEAKARLFFAVHPVFFGWEDLAEEKQKQEGKERENYWIHFPVLHFHFPFPSAPVFSHSEGYIQGCIYLVQMKSYLTIFMQSKKKFKVLFHVSYFKIRKKL